MWVNNRVGDDVVAKRPDRFLIHSWLLVNGERFRSWINKTCLSYHFPIFLELAKDNGKPSAPFKFNHAWTFKDGFN